ncbi:hypothetical protein LCGC14_0765140 [marine sediment metagenome]|uniref:Uncharacterized protein n=1 Tax=marine sediment metagenome TaxID=412755 RepID=A0A0F9SK61_9ZZZZ
MVDIYSMEDIGRDDGQSLVEFYQVKAVCNQCGASYEDVESIEQARKGIADGYAPCPNLSCPGELEVNE